MKFGILYDSTGKVKKREISIRQLVMKLKAIAWFLRWTGAGLVFVAFVGIGYVLQPWLWEEIRYYTRPMQSSSKLGSALRDLPDWQPEDTNYSLFIPKIQAKSVVVDNVRADNEAEYFKALKRGVAAAAGLSHPGLKGTTYLFAHSTDSAVNFARYNAVFYLLGKLGTGDEVEVMYQNKLYKYLITSKEILDATNTKYLTPQTDRELLVLQTCYPPGTTWKRLVIVAQPQPSLSP